MYLYLNPSLPVSIHPYLSLSVYLSSISLPVYLSLSFSISRVYLYLSVSVFLSISVYLSFCMHMSSTSRFLCANIRSYCPVYLDLLSSLAILICSARLQVSYQGSFPSHCYVLETCAHLSLLFSTSTQHAEKEGHGFVAIVSSTVILTNDIILAIGAVASNSATRSVCAVWTRLIVPSTFNAED